MQSAIDQILAQVGKIVLGKDQQVRLAVSCLLAKGHLLIEDLPGMGKTTLAQALSTVLGLKYNRVQFTSDLLPADILGAAVFDREMGGFNFHPGPIFTQVLLADEINRTTPKTQSALLEAMEEGQVSTEGETRFLPQPFFVIATQNPQSQSGTFPLPESQLDRFLMRISLGYPSQASERTLFGGVDPRKELRKIEPALSLEQLIDLEKMVESITASDALLDYLQKLVSVTRTDPRFTYGLSTRGALAWLKAAKSWAMIHNRDYVIPEDIQTVMPSVVGHRVRGTSSVGVASQSNELLTYLLESVEVVR